MCVGSEKDTGERGKREKDTGDKEKERMGYRKKDTIERERKSGEKREGQGRKK